jgi:hypothetical protein
VISVRVDRITLLTNADRAKKLKVSEWNRHSYLKKGVMPRPSRR